MTDNDKKTETPAKKEAAKKPLIAGYPKNEPSAGFNIPPGGENIVVPGPAGEPIMAPVTPQGTGKPGAVIKGEWKEVSPRGFSVNGGGIIPAGNITIYSNLAGGFANTVPNNIAYIVTGISSTMTLQPGAATINFAMLDWFLMRNQQPLYYGRLEVSSQPNIQQSENAVHKVSFAIPERSSIYVLWRRQTVSTIVGNNTSFSVNVNGYLVDEPYQMGSGDLSFPPLPIGVVEWTRIENAYMNL